MSPFTLKFYQEHPDATIKYTYLSCIQLFDNKTELKIHVEELHFVNKNTICCQKSKYIDSDVFQSSSVMACFYFLLFNKYVKHFIKKEITSLV